MVFISPKNIIVDFLRHRLTDPRSRAENSRTEEFNGGGKTFSLSPSSGTMSCITEVTVNGVAQTKWKKYYIDFQNQKVIFYSNTASGTNNVDITYKQGTSNWIYPDKAKKTLDRVAFPRMNILIVGGSGERLGQYNSNVESTIHFQIDVWTKENQKQTIGSTVYEGDKLAEYFAYQVTLAFRANEDDLHPELYNYTLLGTPRDLGYDQEMQCFHKVVEVELKGIDVSEGE
ncbi:MAG: hypothetical protein QQN41_00025 [Nitrosopumilus sp.]